MEQLTETLMHPALWLAALAIGLGGEVAKKLTGAKAGDAGWRGVYFVTLPVHAPIIGALLGLASVAVNGWLGLSAPTSDAFAEGLGPVLFYSGAGVLASLCYVSIVRVIKRAVAAWSPE